MINREKIAAIRLRTIRKAKGFKIYELAAQAYVSKDIVSNIECERRRMSIEVAIALARVLDVRPEWLLALDMVQWPKEEEKECSESNCFWRS